MKIIAIDENDHESMGRSITLPRINAALNEGEGLRRGIMNHLDYEVENLGSSDVSNIRLVVNVEGRDHTSGTFSLQPSASSTIPVVIGGYPDLPDVAALNRNNPQCR